MTFAGKRYEVRGKTEAEAKEKLKALRQTLVRGDFLYHWFRFREPMVQEVGEDL